MDDTLPDAADPARRRARWGWASVGAALLISLGVLVVTDSGDVEVRTEPTTASPTIPGQPAATTAPTPTSAQATTTPCTPTTAPTTTSPPTTTTTTTAAPDGLRRDDEGDGVLALQRRLDELGYWLGEPDGVFGETTFHAVVALQKVAGLARDGIVGPATSAALAEGVTPAVRSSSGRIVEIDLATQVLVIVDDGRVLEVFDTSTGSVPGSTPVGHWTVTREIDGLRQAPLGLLYRPKYFEGGVAVHGYTSVPAYPASHGCVRVTYPAMDAIWARDLMPIGTPVWVY